MRAGLLGGFLLQSIAWLLLCLALWYPIGGWLAAPIGGLAGLLMEAAFPAWVVDSEREGAVLDLVTSLQLPPPPGAPAGSMTLVAEADYRAVGYGLPLLLALLLASRPRRMPAKMAAGILLLVPFQVWSVCFTWLKQAVILAGDGVAAQAGFGASGRELVALGYQFGYLVLPSLAPVAIWLALDRKLLPTLLVEGYLERAEPDG